VQQRDFVMKHELTLTRWHKVVQRIGAAVKEREERTVAALTATSISPWNKEGIEAKAAEIAERARADLALVESGTAAIARIRAALGERNAALGVSERLAQADAGNRRAKLYRDVLEKQKADMVRPADVRHLPLGISGDEPIWSRGSAGIRLAIADAALLEELRAKLAREQARVHGLLDAVADANREKLELDLADELAEIAGLAA
jgi:hypothetical protein